MRRPATIRTSDWSARLAALLSAVETRPFDAHRWNCGRFALAAVEAVTGERPAFPVEPDLSASADSAGFPRIPPLLARMGGIVLAPDPDRVGVVLDAGRVAFVGPRALLRTPIAATGRGLLLNANRGVTFVVQTTHAKEFALARWLVGGTDGGRLCVRCFDGAGTVREN